MASGRKVQKVTIWTHFGVEITTPKTKIRKFHKNWNLQNLCSSSRFLRCFFWKFHDFTLQKLSKSIRGVAKSEGPVPGIAKGCKWTYVLKQKSNVSLILPKKVQKCHFFGLILEWE